MRTRWWTHRDDEGFTLVEVIVALTLLAVVASAALVFFVRGTSGIAAMQRKQSAVALANQATDLARSVAPANLVAGRDADAVLAAWKISSAPDKALGYPASGVWSENGPLVPLTVTQRVSNQTYEVATLVGTCYRKRAVLTNSGCTLLAGSESAPSVTPSGLVKMYRVIVEVTWDAKGQASGCTDGRCVYRVSTLVDPTGDPTWNVRAAPIPNATARRVPAQAGEKQAVDLQVVSMASNTDTDTQFVITASSVDQGQLAVDGTTYDQSHYRGKVLTYTPPQNTLGTWTLTYHLVNGDGKSSSSATLTIKVVPVAGNDTATVQKGQTVTVNAGQNDRPNDPRVVEYTPNSSTRTAGTCTIGSPDAYGRVDVTGGGVTEKCVFSYTIQGTGGNASLVSDAATITVTVTS